MPARPPQRAALPAPPPGAVVTAWAALLDPAKQRSPQAAIVCLLNVSWLRWQLYAMELNAQVEAARGDSPDEFAAVGLVTEKYLAYKDEQLPQGEEIRALVQLEGQERDRCARLAKDAMSMGITGGDW